ncbi:IucA/IucC family protein [Actinoalloteichus hymeniacidonis]|uniref:Siderophore synthetase component n=1 Tax=Actinoalloteichus hymeniacidonis TaxID=340345 RepID=A0AAC9N0C9_9PSEU|nr:IucA/IucC family siderophore biosynthesis protein [Actinoalloteichus hymeniacidonis]AOS65280.1 siderophore synthetase component [Actinoalloteichus hymeniacidonis]MBB5906636.1 siderophore synthetase component [Actinoalloteichus hymeniacidonis]
MNPQDMVGHLTPQLWAQANRHLVRKALAEFAHERLLNPQALSDGSWQVLADDSRTAYTFTARRFGLDHWQLDAASITRRRDDVELPVDAIEFVLDLRASLELDEQTLPVYLEEINATLAARALALSRPAPTAAELAVADFQTIETGMSEGHPCFVANGGRIGFDVVEQRRHAPESGVPVRLIWVAARRDRSTFTSAVDLDYDTLMRGELSQALRDRFAGTLAVVGLTLDDVRLIPVHPWQWWNRLSVTFAGEIARQDLICLGEGEDSYLAQQSIRTFFNISEPTRHYVKTALSVVNMGFVRGLSAEYMRVTPAINDWLSELFAGDDTLRANGVGLLRERAAIGYHHRQYEAGSPKGSIYRKMLAALWRESPAATLAPGERTATMASLLHVDRDGRSLVGALIAGSGQEGPSWLRSYLDAYLVPLLHCFYAYDLVFMPHGENIILVLDERGIVRRVLLKDLAEEVVVMSNDTPLPADAERIRAEVPEQLRALSLFTDVFDCFFRFLVPILVSEDLVSEEEFWAVVADCVLDYQKSTPALADRFARYDLFVDRFALSCLNRLQLRNSKQMVDLTDPAGSLRLVGELTNPLACHARAALPAR